MDEAKLTPELLDNALMFFLRDNPEHYSYCREHVSSNGYSYRIWYDGDPVLEVLIWEEVSGAYWAYRELPRVPGDLENWLRHFEARGDISRFLEWQKAQVYMRRAREAEAQTSSETAEAQLTSRQAGRKPDKIYDRAFEELQKRKSIDDTYDWFCDQVGYTKQDKGHKDNFVKAMRRRENKRS